MYSLLETVLVFAALSGLYPNDVSVSTVIGSIC